MYAPHLAGPAFCYMCCLADTVQMLHVPLVLSCRQHCMDSLADIGTFLLAGLDVCCFLPILAVRCMHRHTGCLLHVHFNIDSDWYPFYEHITLIHGDAFTILCQKFCSNTAVFCCRGGTKSSSWLMDSGALLLIGPQFKVNMEPTMCYKWIEQL